MGARCEQYVENEERAPAEDEREKNESQNLAGDGKRAAIIELRSLVTRNLGTGRAWRSIYLPWSLFARSPPHLPRGFVACAG